jgi:hypothetical protein
MANDAVWAVPFQHIDVTGVSLNAHAFPSALFESQGVTEAFAVNASDFDKKTIGLIPENHVQQHVFAMLAKVFTQLTFLIKDAIWIRSLYPLVSWNHGSYR